jgi:hypothetical protein
MVGDSSDIILLNPLATLAFIFELPSYSRGREGDAALVLSLRHRDVSTVCYRIVSDSINRHPA